MENDKKISRNDVTATPSPDRVGDSGAIQSHAWRGTWSRPMNMPEKGQHPFTIARMTDHNVKGRD